MKFIVAFCFILAIGQAFSLDVVQNKTGAQQVQDALKKAESESNSAAKVQNNDNGKNSKETKQKDTKNFLKLNSKTDDEIDDMIAKKMAQLQKLRDRHRQLVHERNSGAIKETAKELSEDEKLIESFKKAETKEKENSKLVEASDKKMVEMAKRLNNLVLRFQKKIGHLSHNSKPSLHEDDDDSTKKITRGGPATSSLGGIDVTALRRALGLLKSKGLKLKNAEESNVKSSYKEDVKLEDRLALEAEEEKKVTSSDNFDDDSSSEAAAGVDKSSATSSLSSESNSMSPKEQASQEMQNYNALISTESNRELNQIQDEINKATQSSMGKVSVVGQRENVPAESGLPSLPGLGGEEFGGAGGAAGSLDGLLNGGGPGGNDPLAAALSAGNGNENDNNIVSNTAAGADLTSSQTTSISDFGGNQEQQQQQQGGAADASLNLGGQQPIEVGLSTPVDMGMYGGAANQQVQLGAENGGAPGGLPEEMQSSLNDVSAQQQMMPGEQEYDQSNSMAYKKSKISKKLKKRQIKNAKSNRFIKGKNYKRTVVKRKRSHSA